MSNHLIDTALLDRIEANPEAYFKNSYCRVKEFMACWMVTLMDNIEVVSQCKGDPYIDSYLTDQWRNVERIKALQKAQEEFRQND